MSTVKEIRVPDISGYSDIPVVEIFVKPGDRVTVEQPLLTLESDKALMDVPSPAAGIIQAVAVKEGDRVSEGALLVLLESTEQAEVAPPPPVPPPMEQIGSAAPAATPALAMAPATAMPAPDTPYASPSVRKFARELDVDIHQVEGSGPKGRITQEDVSQFVKRIMHNARSAPAAVSELGLVPWPQVDFAQFGPVETRPMPRIKKMAGANLHRNWVMIPHVTSSDEADITDLEAFRQQLNTENTASDAPVTLLAFLVKACAAALRQFPIFNTSLDGDQLVYRQYYHIGFAVDTPGGLLVPVIHAADQKGLREIAREIRELTRQARAGTLQPGQMQGGCFTISSLGKIGGTGFTPIINAPEVAILGVARSGIKPHWNGQAFVPRLFLPLSLAWDHRVIDGAEAGRFNTYLVQVLADFRRIVL